MTEPTPHAKWRNDVITASEKQAKAQEKAAEQAETKPASKS